jgi:hypothetical protein
MVMAVASHGGALREQITGAFSASVSGTAIDGVYAFGNARVYQGGSDFFNTPSSLDSPTSYSWLVRAKVTSFGSFGGLFAKCSNNSNTNGFGTFADTSGTLLLYGSNTNAGDVQLDNITLLTPIVKPSTSCVTWDGAKMRSYRGGNLLLTTTYSTPVTAGNGPLKIMSNRDTSPTSGYHDHTVVWAGRVLSDDEACYLTSGDNSYEIFPAARSTRFLLTPSAASSAIFRRTLSNRIGSRNV